VSIRVGEKSRIEVHCSMTRRIGKTQLSGGSLMTKSLTTEAVLLSVGLLLQACGSKNPPPPVPAIVDVNGGLSASGTLGSVFIVDGTGFGNLTAQASGYSLDFRDATSNSVVASSTSTVNYAGSAWQSLFIIATVPTTGLTASTTYKVTVTTPGGTSNSVSFLILSAVPYAPNTVWTKTYSLPVATQGFPTAVATIGTGVTATTYVYALGGNTANSGATNGKAANTAAVSSNKLDPATGALSLATWTQTTALPAARGFSAAVVATSFNSKVGGNGTIYVLGGLDATGTATSTIYEVSLNADGTIPAVSPAAGSWTALTATPLPQALFAHAAVIFHGHIYVAGGNDSTGTPVAKVYSASINADGTLGAWTTLVDLPDKRAHHQLVTAAGNLYVLGGTNAVGVDPISNAPSTSVSTIFYQAINLKDGTLTGTTWTTNGTGLSKSREKFSAVVAGGGVLASGGLYNGAINGSTEQEFASINTDGSLSSFTTVTGSTTITKQVGGYNFYNQSSAYFADTAGKPHVLILGGAEISNTASSGTPHAEVWYQ
jgi:hypothetical protein